MAQQVLIWTAVPGGTADSPRLSVVVSPRLTPEPGDEPVLATFPDLLDWPGLVAGATWTVEFGDGTTGTAEADLTGLDPALWAALFPPEVPVRPYGFADRRGARVIGYPVAQVRDLVHDAYRRLGALAPAAAPPPAVLLGDRGGLLGAFAQRWDDQARERALANLQNRDDLRPRDAVARFLLYVHQPPPEPLRDLEADPPDFGDVVEGVDVHQAIASIGAYPALLRALGLVVDLTLPGPLPAGPGTVAVRPSIAGAGDARPATAWGVSGGRFVPLPDPQAGGGDEALRELVADGYLVLDPALFSLTELDVDGSGLKLVQAATGVAALAASGSPRPQEGLPALRSAGLTLARAQRSYLLGALADRAGRLQDAFPATGPLHQDDLVRGVRLDVWDDATSAWHSLMRRRGVYTFTEPDGTTTSREFADEATVEPATTSPAPPTAAPPPAPGPDQWLHDTVARWDGWSLAAPRPGTPLHRSADPGRALEPDPSAATPVTAFSLATAFTPEPGTLPQLRFGRRYRVRARVVDVAGAGLPPDDPTETWALPAHGAVPYRRFEPVAAPLVVLREPLPLASAGETLTRLVLRSANVDPSLDGAVLATPVDRHLAPPRIGVQQAELHGVLDDPATGALRTDPATYADLAARDAAELGDDAAQPPARPEPQLEVTWLPDPLAGSGALRGLPGMPVDGRADVDAGVGIGIGPDGSVLTRPWPVAFPGVDLDIPPDVVALVGFGDAWPQRLPFRLVVADRSGAPVWDPAARTLTVGLGKSRVATVGLSSAPGEQDLRLMAVWELVREFVAGLAADPDQAPVPAGELEVAAVLAQVLARRAPTGGHWMLTPPRELTLVHAVQQPLGLPVLGPLHAGRDAGAGTAWLAGGLTVHGPSTLRADLVARWEEPVDDPDSPEGFHVVSGSGPVDELRLGDPAVAGSVTAGGSPPRVTGAYTPTDGAHGAGAQGDGRIAEDTIEFRPLEPGAPVHHFGDTRHRVVRYRAVATSRFREYFADQTLDFTRSSAEVVVDVPASARPAAPRLAGAVPAFGWQRDTSTTLLSSVRRAALRIWLEPPWFSSGEGELLGVVLYPGGLAAPTDDERVALRPYVTQWGVDPLWPAGPVGEVPAVGDVLGAVATARFVALPELGVSGPGVPSGVDVAAVPVAFDPGRRRWYADVALSAPGSYAPFVRLALARYQASALPGCELSPVVLADCRQLSPDRALVATWDPLDPGTVSVTVSGATYQLPGPQLPFPHGRPDRTTVDVNVEHRLDAVDDDELGWAPATVDEVAITRLDVPTADGTVLWQGTVTFLADRAPGAYRLVVGESEWLFADPPGRAAGLGRPASRVVYADRLPL